jgi:hypothetical protein
MTGWKAKRKDKEFLRQRTPNQFQLKKNRNIIKKNKTVKQLSFL